jgi:hypothetical protein
MKKQKKNQTSWIAYLPWAKSVINDKGSMHFLINKFINKSPHA